MPVAAHRQDMETRMRMIFKAQERIHLPWQSTTGQPVEGTVTDIEPARFKVTWDSPADRKSGVSRFRCWYPAYQASRFRRGNAPGKS
jgi:hypothetical protein